MGRYTVGFLAFAVLLLATTGCSAQVAGMNSPVFHDYGEIEWVPLDRVIEQRFIAGTGYSAAIQNDPAMLPEEYIERLSELPEDATDGELKEIRIALRVAGQANGVWATGALIEVAHVGPSDGRSATHPGLQHFIEVDSLPRSGDKVILDNLPDLAAGDVASIVLLPGDGPHRDHLQVAMTPHRAPYAGWRATSDGEILVGALLYETRYQRDVAVGEVVEVGLDRMMGNGGGFVVLWLVVSGGLLTGIVVLSKQRGGTDGR